MTKSEKQQEDATPQATEEETPEQDPNVGWGSPRGIRLVHWFNHSNTSACGRLAWTSTKKNLSPEPGDRTTCSSCWMTGA